MLELVLTPAVVEKLQTLLKNEHNEDTVLRIKETKVGAGCKSHIELRLGIDEREDSEEEQELTLENIPFVVGNDVIDSYGEKFSISLNEDQFPVIKPIQ